MKSKKIVLQRCLSQQQGVTLIELMISMVLGLLILVGVVYIFSGTRKSYDYNEIMARVQENGRIATSILNSDLRMTGYFGCGSVGRYDHRTGVGSGFFVPTGLLPGNAFKDASFHDITAVGGVGTGTPGTPGAPGIPAVPGDVDIPLAGTDTLTVVRTSAAFPVASQDAAGMFTVATGSDISFVAPGNTLVVSNCKTVNVFEVDSVDTTSRTITPTTPTVTPDSFGKEAYIMTFASNQYSIRNTSRRDRSGVQVKALFRSTVGGANAELVEGVEGMRISYGVDTDGDGNVDAYQPFAAGMNWEQVIAIRVDLLVASEDGVLTQAQPYTYAGATFTPTDRKMRQAFSTTVALRNRIP